MAVIAPVRSIISYWLQTIPVVTGKLRPYRLELILDTQSERRGKLENCTLPEEWVRELDKVGARYITIGVKSLIEPDGPLGVSHVEPI
jgi:hypothetical protein